MPKNLSKPVLQQLSVLEDQLGRSKNILDGKINKNDLKEVRDSVMEQIEILEKIIKSLRNQIEKTFEHALNISEILEIPLQLRSLNDHLLSVLNKIVSLPNLSKLWIQEWKWAIYLWDGIDRNFKLNTHVWMSEKHSKKCSSFTSWACLCGDVAQSQDSLVRQSFLDEMIFDCIWDDGPYLWIPIWWITKKLLWVLRLSLLKWKWENDIDLNKIEDLADTIWTVVSSHKQRIIELLPLYDKLEFKIDSFEKVHQAVYLLSFMCPNPKKVDRWFYDALVNAWEHGVLDISFELKSKLRRSKEGLDPWRDEVDKRNATAVKEGKYVSVTFTKHEDRLVFEINDFGKGFNPEDFKEYDINRVIEILHWSWVSHMFEDFDEVIYNEKWNKVTLVVYLPKEWGGMEQLKEVQ